MFGYQNNSITEQKPFNYRGVRLSNQSICRFDNRMFGYRGTTVVQFRNLYNKIRCYNSRPYKSWPCKNMITSKIAALIKFNFVKINAIFWCSFWNGKKLTLSKKWKTHVSRMKFQHFYPCLVYLVLFCGSISGPNNINHIMKKLFLQKYFAF